MQAPVGGDALEVATSGRPIIPENGGDSIPDNAATTDAPRPQSQGGHPAQAEGLAAAADSETSVRCIALRNEINFLQKELNVLKRAATANSRRAIKEFLAAQAKEEEEERLAAEEAEKAAAAEGDNDDDKTSPPPKAAPVEKKGPPPKGSSGEKKKGDGDGEEEEGELGSFSAVEKAAIDDLTMKINDLSAAYSAAAQGETFQFSDVFRAECFTQELYYELSSSERENPTLRRLFHENCAAIFGTAMKPLMGKLNVADAFISMFEGLEVKYEQQSVIVEQNPPATCKIYALSRSLLTVGGDAPRRLLEIFELDDAEEAAARSLDLQAKKYVMVNQDARPLFVYPEAPLPVTSYVNTEGYQEESGNAGAEIAADAAEEAAGEEEGEEEKEEEQEKEEEKEEEDDEVPDGAWGELGGDATAGVAVPLEYVPGDDEEDEEPE